MMRPLRTFIIAGLILTAAACGFQPLYTAKQTAQNPEASAGFDLARIQVGTIPNREGQLLRQFLVSRLNPVGEPRIPQYRLDVSLSESKKDLGIQRDTSVTFARLEVTAQYRIRDVETDQTLFQDSARSLNSYNVVESPYATQVAEQNARERAMEEIAESIRFRLASFFTTEGSRQSPSQEMRRR